MLNISEIGELERRYLTRLRLNDTDLPADKFDRRTCVQRNVIDEKKAKKIQQIKNRINDAVARIYATMLPLAETEEYTLILDGREAKTTAALQKFSSILASSILSPNVSVESASALKEAGVSAWAGRVEDFLKFMEQRPLLSLIYLDHTGAFPPRHWQVRRSFQFLASSGGVIAFTFSTRSGRWLDEDNKEVLAPPPLSTWGGAEAVYALISSCQRACVDLGWEMVGDEDLEESLGLQSYELNPPHPHPLAILSSALADWAVKAGREGKGDDRSKIYAIKAAEAASRVLLGKTVLGVVWTTTSTEAAKERRRPSQVMTESGGISDNDVKRLIRIARDVGLTLPESSVASRNFKGVVQVYPEQMMWCCLKVKKKLLL
jgi:hypothetical protein